MDAARMQDAVGEDVAALTVTGKLDLVDSDEIKPLRYAILALDTATAGRHRFHRAAQIPCARRQNAFLTGDQPDLGRTKACHQPFVILARQKPQRETDHPRAIAGHPFHRQMGLAGVGRAKDSRDSTVILPPVTGGVRLRATCRKRGPVWGSG